MELTKLSANVLNILFPYDINYCITYQGDYQRNTLVRPINIFFPSNLYNLEEELCLTPNSLIISPKPRAALPKWLLCGKKKSSKWLNCQSLTVISVIMSRVGVHFSHPGRLISELRPSNIKAIYWEELLAEARSLGPAAGISVRSIYFNLCCEWM